MKYEIAFIFIILFLGSCLGAYLGWKDGPEFWKYMNHISMCKEINNK